MDVSRRGDRSADVRRSFAQELRTRAGVRSERLVAAFAAVPRERFVGPAVVDQ